MKSSLVSYRTTPYKALALPHGNEAVDGETVAALIGKAEKGHPFPVISCLIGRMLNGAA